MFTNSNIGARVRHIETGRRGRLVSLRGDICVVLWERFSANAEPDMTWQGQAMIALLEKEPTVAEEWREMHDAPSNPNA
jgi:hypothetical protein